MRLIASFLLAVPALAQALSSPDGQLQVDVSVNDRQQLVYTVQRAGQPVLLPSRLGLVLEQGDYANGLTLLATVGATAPFVGLLGTVWGIQQALVGLSGAGALTIDRIAGPVGEALLMTAAGLLVAIPAVLAYNVLGKRVVACEAALEGLAHDLRAWALARA